MVPSMVSIDSGNGWLPAQCQAITCTNIDLLLLSIWPIAKNFIEILIKVKIFFHKNACKYVCNLDHALLSWVIIIPYNIHWPNEYLMFHTAPPYKQHNLDLLQ